MAENEWFRTSGNIALPPVPGKIADVADFLERCATQGRYALELDRLDLCLAVEQMNFDHFTDNRHVKTKTQLAVSAVALHLREECVRTPQSMHRVRMALLRLRHALEE